MAPPSRGTVWSCPGSNVMMAAEQQTIPQQCVPPEPGAQVCMQVCHLENGMLPDLDTVLSWMAQFPTAGPLWQQEGQADYLYDSSGYRSIGVYCRGPRGGSVNVYASGKVVVQGNPATRLQLLGMIRDWAVPRNCATPASSSRSRPSLARFRVQGHGQPY